MLLFSVHCFSQKNEIGIFLGGTNYIGDVGPTRYLDPGRYEGEKVEFGTKNSAFGIFYRKNFNKRSSRLNYE